MKKNRAMSLLAASAILFSIHASSSVLAENSWNGMSREEWEAQQQYVFVSVPDGEDVSFLFDESFFQEPEEEPADEATPDPTLAPPVNGTPIPSDLEFVLDGTALIKYQGKAASVFVPEGVTVIRGGAFAGNKSVVSVFLPDSVREIESGAFKNCAKLMFITVSGKSKLSTIGTNAFDGCPLLDVSFARDIENVSQDAFPQHPELFPTAQPTFTPKPTATARPTPVNPGSKSGGAVPTVKPSTAGTLKITRQPVSVRAAEGALVSFVVVAEGSPNIQYQWLRSKDGENWVEINNNSQAFENAATNVLSFTATAIRASYLFRCRIFVDSSNPLYSKVVSVTLDPNGASQGVIPTEPDPWDATAAPFPDVTPDPGLSSADSSPSVKARQIGDDSAEITWTALPSAVSYELYRYAENKQDYKDDVVLIDTFQETSYTDHGLDFSQYKYTYTVIANLDAMEDGQPVKKEFANAVVKSLAPPEDVYARQIADDAVIITWSPSELASHYKVFRAVNDGEFAELTKAMRGTEYTDTGLDFNRNTYRYQVQALMAVPGSNTPISATSDEAPTEEFSKVGQSFSSSKSGLEYTIIPEGLVVTGYKGTASELTITSQVQYKNTTYTVVAIGPNVFWGNKTLKSIKLPPTIQVIEAGAFGYCSAIVD